MRVIRKGKIQHAIVGSLYAGAALTLMVAMPNTLQLLKYIQPHLGERNANRRMSQAISRLVSRGFLKRDGYGHSARLSLTSKGSRYAESLLNDPVSALKRPRRWDGRWRIVMFDIWEKRRHVRDRLRGLLCRIGFVKIQNSVWAYPYDCEEVIALVRAELKVGRGVSYLIAEALEGDKGLREQFGLKS